MTKPLSTDLRLRVVEAVDAGMSRRAAAERFGVAASAAIKWHGLWRRTGAVDPRRQGGDRRSHVPKRQRRPSSRRPRPPTSRSRRSRASWRDHDERFTPSSFSFLPGAGISSKKTPKPPSRSSDVAHRRHAGPSPADRRSRAPCFIDETGASTQDGASLLAPTRRTCCAPIRMDRKTRPSPSVRFGPARADGLDGP